MIRKIMFNILAVDDDPLMLRLLEEFLSKYSFNIIGCGDGSEALKKLVKNDIDLIISDINMRPMDGITFLESLRAKGDMTPFILITAQPDIETFMHSVHHLDAFEYIEKPFDLDILLEMVNRLLSGESKKAQGE